MTPQLLRWCRARSDARHVRPSVELLEDRAVPSANLVGFDLTSGDLSVSSGESSSVVGHWDPYGFRTIVNGDFDGDGKMDIAGWNSLGYWQVAHWIDDTLVTDNWLTVRSFSGFSTFQVGDFDGDGNDDIAMFAVNGQWQVAHSTGAGFQLSRWDQPGDWRPGAAWRNYVVGDFNGDHLTDVAALGNDSRWQVGISTGSQFITQTWLPAKNWPGSMLQNLAVGDFNGDDMTDVAAVLSNKTIIVSLSTGSSFTAPAVWARFPTRIGTFSFVSVGDFNGDDRADVVAYDRSTGQVWMFQSQSSFFTPMVWAKQAAAPGNVVKLTIGDFTGDGRTDIALLLGTRTWLVGNIEGDQISYSIGGAYTSNWFSTFSSAYEEPDRWIGNRSVFWRGQPYASFISTQDLARLRHDPSYFTTIFQAYRFAVAAQLVQPFPNASDEVIAFSLASIVAYQAAPYRGLGDPAGTFPPPRSIGLYDLLHTAKLVCNEYCYLATQLYLTVFPTAANPDTSLIMMGFGSGPIGNHAQLLLTVNGVSVLGDPTLGLVAKTTYAGLFTGALVPSSYVRQPIGRVEYAINIQQCMLNLRTLVVSALTNGLYLRARVIYVMDVTDGH